MNVTAAPTLLYQIITALIIILNVLAIVFLFATNQKGFSIVDEGFYLLSAQYPLDVQIWPNVAHIYGALIYHSVGQNIIYFRLFGELLMLGSALIFYWGWYRLVTLFFPASKRIANFRIITWSLINLSVFLYYIFIVRTPSYDLFDAILLNATTGLFCLILTYLSLPMQKTRQALAISFFSGILTGALLLVKFPAAITTVLLFSLILSLWPSISKRTVFFNIVMLLCGISIWVLFHIIFLQQWSSVWHTIHDGIISITIIHSDHNIGALLRYCSEIIDFGLRFLLRFFDIYLILVIGMLFLSWYLKNKKNAALIVSIFIVSVFFLDGLQSFFLDLHIIKNFASMVDLIEVYAVWLLLIAIAVLFVAIDQKNKRRILLASLFFLIAPFVGAVGTGNSIVLNILLTLAPWFGLMELWVLLLTLTYHNHWILLSNTLILSIFIFCQLIFGALTPYGLNSTIFRQTFPTAIGSPATILETDRATNSFFNKIDDIANRCQFKPGEDILAFSNMPGIVFALGGRSPVVPWYNNVSGAKTANGWILQHTTLMRIKKAFILQNEYGQVGFPDLTKFGINFPADYTLCGQAIWPMSREWVRLWKPQPYSK